MPKTKPEYTYSELRVLWHLKRHGPIVDDSPYEHAGGRSVYGRLATDLDMRRSTVKYTVRALEDRSLVLRTYERPKVGSFANTMGYNPLVKLELVDPQMWLPELPKLSLGVVIARENEELAERVAEDPSIERALVAVLDRNDELQAQINKLCGLVEALEQENEKLKKEARPPRQHISAGLNQRVKEALTDDQWQALRHTR